MKKWLKVLILITVTIIISVAIFLVDSLRVVEKPLDTVVQIAKEKDGDNINGGIYAYTLEKQTDKIILTHYFAMDRSKSIKTFYIENGIVTKCFLESHFTTKWLARDLGMDSNDKKINGNVVTGWISLEQPYDLAEDLYNKLEKQLNRFAVKLN